MPTAAYNGRMARPYAELWGRRIEAARTKAQLRQLDVARAVGVTRQAVAAWEAGISCPLDPYRPAIAKALGVDQAKLFSIPVAQRRVA